MFSRLTLKHRQISKSFIGGLMVSSNSTSQHNVIFKCFMAVKLHSGLKSSRPGSICIYFVAVNLQAWITEKRKNTGTFCQTKRMLRRTNSFRPVTSDRVLIKRHQYIPDHVVLTVKATTDKDIGYSICRN